MISFPQARLHFLSYCRLEKKLSSKTLTCYETDLRQFEQFIGREKFFFETLNKTELRAYLESLSSLKTKSIKRKIATLKALYNFLESEELMVANPLRKLKMKMREAKRLPTILDVSEIGRMLGILYERRERTQVDTYAYREVVRDIVVVELLFATGGRVSEVAKLRLTDIDLQTGNALIHGKGNRERLIQVCHEESLLALQHYVAIWSTQLTGGFLLVNRLGHNLSEQSIRHLIKRLSKQAGIEKRVTPHVFRHSFATHLLERDVDITYIQALLGHSSIATTQIYTHVNRAKQRQILIAKHPRREMSYAKPLVDAG